MNYNLPILTGPARWSLVEFGSMVVPDYRRRVWWYHRQIAEALEGMLRYVRFRGKRGGYARVAISMPPQHGKSLHGTELFPAFALAQDPDLKIIVASNGATLAKKGIDNTRMWMSDPAYHAAYPTRFGRVEEFDPESSRRTRVLEVESSSQFFRTIRPRGGRSSGAREMVEGHGYYLAQGIGGSITGWGYDIGVMDDLVKNAEQALSKRHHEKLWEFYTSTFDTRERDEFAVQLYIGTRWTKPDFADELIDYWRSQATKDHDIPVKVLKFPALAEENFPLAESDPRSDEAFVEEHGAGLDNPTHRSASYYIGKRQALKSQTPWVWDGMWQQEPQMAGTKFFQPEDWATYDENFNLRALNFIDFSIDANLSATGPSYAVILVTGVLQVGRDLPNEQGEHYFLLDEARGHWDYGTLESEFLRLRRKWEIAMPSQTSAGAVWVENKALGPTLITKFQGQYPIVAVPKAKSKIYCYRVASPVTAMQRVRIPVGTWGEDPTTPGLPLITDEWVGDAKTKGSWIAEMMSHPSKPDDRRDALAQQVICRTSWLGMHLLGAS